MRALGKTGIARENANMGNLISEETLHKLEADASFQQLSQMMQTLNIFEVLGTTPCSTPKGIEHARSK